MKLFYKYPHALLGAAATALLIVAYGFQFAGFLPCELCWWQRYPYFAVVGVALLAILLGKRVTNVALLLISVLFAVDAGIALFHVGVEQHWWDGLDSCGALVDIASMSADELLDYMSNEQPPRCDEAAWSFAGLSMAAWNGLAAVSLFLLTVVSYRSRQRQRRFY